MKIFFLHYFQCIFILILFLLIFNYLWTVWCNILSIINIFFVYQLILLNYLLITLRISINVILHYVFFLNFLGFYYIFYNSSLVFIWVVYFSTLIEIFIYLVLVFLHFIRIKRNFKDLLSVNRLYHIQIINWILANYYRLYHLILIEVLLLNEYWLVLKEIYWILSII